MKHFKEFLTEKTTDTVFVWDIDDTLFFTKSKIGIKRPGEDKWEWVSTTDFAEIRDSLPKETEYDFSDFSKYKSIYMSISKGKPNIKVLKLLDKAIHKGHKIGILTARGNQSAIYRSIKDNLLYRNKKGELVPLPKDQFNKQFVFAISDLKTGQYIGSELGGADKPENRKAYVLQKIFGDMYGFSNIIFVDDDEINISKVKSLNDDRIKTIKV